MLVGLRPCEGEDSELRHPSPQQAGMTFTVERSRRGFAKLTKCCVQFVSDSFYQMHMAYGSSWSQAQVADELIPCEQVRQTQFRQTWKG